MAIINYDFYCGEDRYSDGSVEDYLKYLVENHIDIDTLPQSDKTYPVIYHLSHLRENIINWYPIRKDQTVLEIGSGCGAITRALCNKAGSVVSVELSKRRAEINFHRNSDMDNLTIYVGNQNDIPFSEKFDYVILNGVFEYAMSFTEGMEPYRTFLKNARSFLKQDGKLLIAIENRLGLKYFTGAPEDHTGNYFLGINQYPDNNTVRTFSRSEWIKLLNSCGLKCKFYYPYPDYKFPTEIFTDKTLAENGYGKEYFNTEINRYGWLNEYDLAKTFTEEGVAGTFSNSFFLEIASDENFVNIDYCKLSCDRRKDTRIITVILHNDDQRWIEKRAANIAAIDHIKNIYKNSVAVLTDKIRNVPGTYENDKVVFPFITGENLSQKLWALLQQGQTVAVKEEICRVFEDYFTALRTEQFTSTDAFAEVFGGAQVSSDLVGVYDCNIDVIFENLYCKDGGYQIIDPEWVFDFAIPRDFVVWRAVQDFYCKNPAADNYLRQNELLEYLGVSLNHVDVFSQWNAHFAYRWLNVNSIESFAKPILTTNMDCMVSLVRANTMLGCSMYFDCGDGYSEEQKLYQEVPLVNNCFSVTFDLSKIENLKSLRFDPIEGKAIRCRVQSEHAVLRPINAWTKEADYDLFVTDDPMYEVAVAESENHKQIQITGYIMPLEFKQCIDKYVQKHDQLTSIISELSNKNMELEMEVQCIYQSKGWRIIQFLRRILNSILG